MEKPWRNWFRNSRRSEQKAIRARADDGDADAQFSLGLKCANGEGEARDYPQAAQWYLKAAGQSHPLAQFNLGMMYAAGQGVPRDDALATVWFERAARQGDPGAQFNLGMRCHRASVGGPAKDALEAKIEAYKWLHLAAAQGYKGSAFARERLTLTMTREEVADGNHRAAAFVAEKTIAPQAA
jgi:hypothetical protein